MKKIAVSILAFMGFLVWNTSAEACNCNKKKAKEQKKESSTTKAVKKALKKGKLATAVIRLEGIKCPMCMNKVKRAIISVKGVISADVFKAKAVVKYDSTKAKVADLVKAVKKTGYLAGSGVGEEKEAVSCTKEHAKKAKSCGCKNCKKK